MKTVVVLLVASLVPSVRADDAAAKKAIEKVLADQEQAWNKGDLEGYMKGYWKSDRLTFFSGGSTTTGWQATLDRYRKRYQGEGKEMGKLTFSDLVSDLVAPDAALVRGRFHLKMKSGEESKGLFTLLMKKFPEGWRIVHDHTSADPSK
jgi:beta-aspartyl-peptidase (threonine type)